jgi:2-polyprenyl-3-methyl-5-hydroxy-6-metoxy-1,4-benzoquinol methylase
MSDASKYEGEVDLSDRNNSRTLMIEMVGANKRVLEVGCATGYVSKVLTERACRVIGIEIDPEAATKAKEFCEDVVVADIETLDLVETFGERRFDAILFGDVLEHLKDPLTVLRGTRPLLDLGGFVVTSLPNIAHGSVRLSLLRGQFEYHDVGLLDETHLRFFTKASIEKLFVDAGLVVVEMRRTRAGIFEVEFSLQPEDFQPELVAEIERDPEAETYQFLAKAVPDDGLQAMAELKEREEGQRIKILDLKRQIESLEQNRLKEQAETRQKLAEIESLDEHVARVELQNEMFRDRWAQFEARRVVRIYRRLQRLLGKSSPELPESPTPPPAG